MGAQDHYEEVPAEASTPAHPDRDPVVPQAPSVAGNVSTVAATPAPVPVVAESLGCCNTAGCRIAYHVVFAVLSIIAAIFLLVAIFGGSLAFYTLFGVDAIIIVILSFVYCCFFGCCCGPATEVVYVSTPVPAANPVVVQMTTQTSNQHYAYQQQPSNSQTSVGYPAVLQQPYGGYQPSNLGWSPMAGHL